MRKNLKNIQDSLETKADSKTVETEMFSIKTELESKIKERVKISSMAEYFDPYEKAAKYNTRKFADIDRQLKNTKSLCDEMSKSVLKCVSSQTYKNDLKSINEKFSECIQYSHLQKHLDFINPTVDDCLEKSKFLFDTPTFLHQNNCYSLFHILIQFVQLFIF